MQPAESLLAGVRRHAETMPTALALADARTQERLDYAALDGALRRVAGLLEAHGVGPGEPVLLRASNSLDLAVCLLGILRAGRISLPTSPDLLAEELVRVRDHAGVRLAITDGLEIDGLPRLPLTAWRDAAEADPCDPGPGALLIYTSGTTGRPKGVLLPQAALAANVGTAADCFGYGPAHRTLALLPLFHTFALVSDVLPMLRVGGAAVIGPGFDPLALGNLATDVARWGIASFSGVPLMFELLRRMRVRLGGGSLRFCVSGAAPLGEATRLGFLEACGVPILPAYGMTEGCCFCSISRPGAVVPGSAGVPVVEVRVLDERDADVAPGAVGEIVLRGRSVIRGGYYRDDRPAYVHDGWLRTGDLGRLDEGANLHITGRKKTMVIRGGEKIYLGDIDDVLRSHADVADAATVGLFDREPERVVSFVVPSTSECDPARLSRWLRERLGARRAPDEIRTLEAIPYTRSGKARLAELQALASQP